jgi:hypothetical protein
MAKIVSALSVDAGAVDAGAVDSRCVDAAAVDSRCVDAGAVDSRCVDAGAVASSSSLRSAQRAGKFGITGYLGRPETKNILNNYVY